MMWIPVIALASATAGAKVVADLVAAPEIPPGSAFAPHTPAGVAIVGTNIWVGDAAQGFRHYVAVDPNNTDPINMGQLKFDIDPNFSMGGGSCSLFCSVGQVAQDGNARVYIAVYDHAKGQPFAPAGGGVYMLPFLSTFTFGAFEGLNTVARGLGLNGNQPTALALGLDGKLYVGFLKNGNIKRVTNPSQINPTPQTQTVESVGTTPNGRNMRAMAFLGPDLYIADQGLSVVRNVATCIGNQGGCGNAVVVRMVTSVPLTSGLPATVPSSCNSPSRGRSSATPRPQTASCWFRGDSSLSMGTPTRFRWTPSAACGSETTSRRRVQFQRKAMAHPGRQFCLNSLSGIDDTGISLR